jgi:hypothetical protein
MPGRGEDNFEAVVADYRLSRDEEEDFSNFLHRDKGWSRGDMNYDYDELVDLLLDSGIRTRRRRDR